MEKKKKKKRKNKEMGGGIGLRSGKGASAARENNFDITKIQCKANYILYYCGFKKQLWFSVEMVLYQI